MSAQGIAQIVFYGVVLSRSATRSGCSWRAHTRGEKLDAGRARAFCGCSAVAAATSRTGRLRKDRADLQRRLHRRALRDPAPAGASLPEPGSPEGRGTAHRCQHDRELRHEHELAVLRRRVHDVVSDPDGRSRGAELRLRGGRHGSAGRRGPRDRAPVERQARELLARPLPVARLHPAAALGGRSPCC